MEDIKISGTSQTPDIEFNVEKGLVVIKGRSIPENAIELYSPLINSLKEFSSIFKQEKKSLELSVQLEYFNTSSSKCILDVFKAIEELKDNGIETKIKWLYEKDDEDMLEAGEDYQAIISIPFEIIEIEEW